MKDSYRGENGGSGGGIMSSLRLHQVSQQQTDDMYPIFAVISCEFDHKQRKFLTITTYNYKMYKYNAHTCG